MPEGKITFHATPTPSWDPLSTVHISAFMSQPGGGGNVRIAAAISVDEARGLAAQIEAACVAVESDVA